MEFWQRVFLVELVELVRYGCLVLDISSVVFMYSVINGTMTLCLEENEPVNEGRQAM